MDKTITTISKAPTCYSYIRFSTPEQLKGDSLRRQLELSEKYASEHGLAINTTLSLQDLGLSAFKGQHRDIGALGRFLDLVMKGCVTPGSVLLVESLDRLSREEITEALEQFLGLIRHGIKIVTLGDYNREYTKESINSNAGELIIGVTIMSRAHEESFMKSTRLSSVWRQKRKVIDQTKLTARCPGWLKLSKDKTHFIEIPENVAVVKRIFQMKASGIGVETIARILNKEGIGWVLNYKKKKKEWNGWRKSYIVKILSNPALLGEFQPYHIERMVDKEKPMWKRKPVGDVVKDYFPRIISEETFYSAQPQPNPNKPHQFAGRVGLLRNLFSGLARCGYCGKPMHFINKGKGCFYLLCDGANRHLKSCEHYSWNYQEIEELVLTFCQGLNVGDLLNTNKVADSELAEYTNKLLSTEGKLKTLDVKIKNLTEEIADCSSKEARAILTRRLSELLESRNVQEKQQKTLEREISKLTSKSENIKQQLSSVKELMGFMKSETGEKLSEVRQRLRHKLRGLIERIDVYPAGHLYRIIPKMKANKALRVLTIYFRSGSYKTLKPESDTVVTQIYVPEEGLTYFPFINAGGQIDADVLDDKELGVKKGDKE